MENINEICKKNDFVSGLRVGEFDAITDKIRDISKKSHDFKMGYKNGWYTPVGGDINDFGEYEVN